MLQVVRGIATSFFFPASVSVVPHTVPAAQLQQANALMRLSQNSTSILGAVVAGALVATIGSGWALAFDAATYFASAAVLSRMRIRGPMTAGANFVRELAEGWREFASRTWLWTVVVAASVGNLVLVGGQAVLGPVVAKESLGGAAGWGGVVAAEGAGLLVGSIVALRWRPARPLFTGVLLLSGTSVFLASLAIPASLPIVILAGAIAGFGLETFNVNWTTTMHEQIPDEVLARVNSYDALGVVRLHPARADDRRPGGRCDRRLGRTLGRSRSSPACRCSARSSPATSGAFGGVRQTLLRRFRTPSRFRRLSAERARDEREVLVPDVLRRRRQDVVPDRGKAADQLREAARDAR